MAKPYHNIQKLCYIATYGSCFRAHKVMTGDSNFNQLRCMLECFAKYIKKRYKIEELVDIIISSLEI